MLEQLNQFLPIAEKVINKKNPLLILKNICLRNGKMIVTDIENYAVIPIDTNLNCIIPITILKNVLRSKPKTFEIKTRKDKTTINYDSRQLKFTNRDVEDFPSLPKTRFNFVGNWNKKVFEYLNNQLPFCSNNELRPALTGVFVSQNSQLESCAVNGSMMKYYPDLGSCEVDKEFSGIIHQKSIWIIKQFADEIVKVSGDNKHYLRFSLKNNIQLYIRLIDEPSVDFKSVIPEHTEKKVQFNRKEMLKLLKDAALFPDVTEKGIFNISHGRIKVSTYDPETDISWNSEISKQGDSSRKPVGMNIKYFTELLKSMNSDIVVWKFSNPISAQVFEETSDNEIKSINLLMPVRLSEDEN